MAYSPFYQSPQIYPQYQPQYPAQYTAINPMQTMQQPMQQPMNAQQNDERIWVANEAAANAYRVVPNGSVRLWDSTRPTFYEKTADAQGKEYPMVIYDYQPRSAAPAPTPTPAVDLSGYVTREELDKRLAALTQKGEDKNE